MPLKLGADLAQAHQVLLREVTAPRQRRVLDRRRMALGEHEAIALRPVRALGIVAQGPEVDRRDEVRGREGAVEVAGLGHREHPHAVDSQHGRPALKLANR